MSSSDFSSTQPWESHDTHGSAAYKAALLQIQQHAMQQRLLLHQQRPPPTVVHEYGPALDGVYWQGSSADTLATTPVLSVIELVFQAGVDLSDSSTAPGKLWQITLQYIRSIPGCSDVKWGSENGDSTAVVALIMWETGIGWKSFQESFGFILMVPLLVKDMRNRSIKLPATASLALQRETTLQQVETTVDGDLDVETRRQFETEYAALLAKLGLTRCLSSNLGWFEHDASGSVYATPEDNARGRTQCIHATLLEFDKSDSDGYKATELAAELRQGAIVSTKIQTATLKIIETLSGDPSTAADLSITPTQGSPATLANTLEHRITRSFASTATQDPLLFTRPSIHKGIRCEPKEPFSHTQGNLYVICGNWPLPAFHQEGSRSTGTSPSPYIVDVAWISMTSTLVTTQRKAAKMLNYRVQKLFGYTGGFWVRSVDAENVFGLFTGMYCPVR